MVSTSDNLDFWLASEIGQGRGDSLAGLNAQPPVPGNKLTQKDNADSRLQFITPVGTRQSLFLAKDPDQFLWKPDIYTLSVRAQIHLPKFPETSLNKGKERYNQNYPMIHMS